MPICAPTLGYSHLTSAITALGEIALSFPPSSNHRAPDRSPSQNPLPTWLCITFWLCPQKPEVTATMYPKLEKVSVLHSTFPSPSLNVQIVRFSLGQSHLVCIARGRSLTYDARTCTRASIPLPTCSGSNSITVRRVHPFCNHAAFGFGVIDCAELPRLEMFHIELAVSSANRPKHGGPRRGLRL